MPLSRDEVLNVARIYRIGLTEEELEQLQRELSDILAQFEVLNELDTEGVEATGFAVPLSMVMREDLSRPSSDREEVMAAAPVRQGEFFLVPPVLEEE